MAHTVAGSAAVRVTAELVVWWVVLRVLRLVLTSSVDLLEWVVGSCAALVAAVAARAARVAATGRGLIRVTSRIVLLPPLLLGRAPGRTR
ncbi:hypothetical protein ACFVTY_05485 [Streptomyces sp. NPDC058067]|uniref:hypothetical protein n=1 Tax=Streptomyces sp. NPDC058067 TaxID=3346324 RepID=UPI0036F09F26